MKKVLSARMSANEKEAFIQKWAAKFHLLKPAVQNEIREYLQNNPKVAERLSIYNL